MMRDPGAGQGGGLAGATRLGRGSRSSRPGEAPSGSAPTVVVVGFGVNGRNLARVLKVAHIAYRVVELNGETVRRALMPTGSRCSSAT